MFERLFDRPITVAKQWAGPLLEERLRYLSHLAEQGVARHRLQVRAYYLLVVAQRLRLAERPGELISSGEIERQARRSAQQPGPRKVIGSEWQRVYFLRYATQWLQFCGRLQPLADPPHRYAELITAFADFLGRDKGLVPSTIRACCSMARTFLDRLGSTVNDSLGTITVTQLDEALAEYVAAGGYSRGTVQEIVCKLRAFFRYAEMCHWCRPGLAAALQAPRVFAQGSLPVHPSWHEVQQVLALTEGNQTVDIRDHALLLLLTVYGLRAGEVVRLRLNDLDWEQELLTVRRSKSGRSQIYPLSRAVGAARSATFARHGRQRLCGDVRHSSPSLSPDGPLYPLPDRRTAIACCEPLPLALRPTHPSSCLRNPPPGARSVAERDWRPLGPSPSRYHPHLRQGRPRPAPPGRRFRSRRCAMNLQQLIDRYIAHRQSLGHSSGPMRVSFVCLAAPSVRTPKSAMFGPSK